MIRPPHAQYVRWVGLAVHLSRGGERMNSTRGTKTLRLQRKKSGLDFSVKGGTEHGIPIVVSWIKDGGAACKCACPSPNQYWARICNSVAFRIYSRAHLAIKVFYNSFL